MHPTDHRLADDLAILMRQALPRRRALRWLGVGAAAPLGLAACGGGEEHGGEALLVQDPPTSGAIANAASCSAIPEETAGPYPADGSNAVGGKVANALALSGIWRSDIRASLAGATGTAGGVPLTLTLRLLNTSAGCANLLGLAVYLWHCDREGRYSMYSTGVTAENYLRGVQVADANGQVSFTTVFPGCYAGRWPHIHFEVYRSLAAATAGTGRLKTSQLALPAAASREVYASSGYGASGASFNQITLAGDSVFSDGVTLQSPSSAGSVAAGYTMALDVGLPA